MKPTSGIHTILKGNQNLAQAQQGSTKGSHSTRVVIYLCLIHDTLRFTLC
jgi:hypothetical protein